MTKDSLLAASSSLCVQLRGSDPRSPAPCASLQSPVAGRGRNRGVYTIAELSFSWMNSTLEFDRACPGFG
jgi:hypothetical protein